MDNEELNKNDDEISLIDLFAVLLKRKVMIISICIIAAVGAVAYSVLSLVLPSEKSPLPNVYKPQALLLIKESGSSGGLSSMLSSSGLGGLASLAGVSVGGGATNSKLAIYLVGTDSMLDTIVDEFNLIERYKIEKSPRTSSRQALKKKLQAVADEESGVISISFEDTDPVFARDVVNFAVYYLENRFDDMGIDDSKLKKENLEKNIAASYEEIKNLEIEMQKLGRSISIWSPNQSSVTLETTRLEIELEAQKEVYTQLKVQYELVKLELSSEMPIFQILEVAEVPDMKSGPSRGLICIIVVFAAGFFAVFLAFVLNAIENIKKDPEAMAKLRGDNI
jgi:uncharacterized protein involved in exopolysaccharide biosynthesis